MTLEYITDDQFRDLISLRFRRLLCAARYFSEHPDMRGALTRPLVGEMLSLSTQMEELLDAYRASRNTTWRDLRSLTATIKRYSTISYVILHIQHALPSYRLLPIEHDFKAATKAALQFTGELLYNASAMLMNQADKLELSIPEPDCGLERLFAETLPPGRLQANIEQHDQEVDIEQVAMIVTKMSTAFLNLASKGEILHNAVRVKPEDMASCVPNPISENSLRDLQHRFHNLQAMYDTYVYNTRAEEVDPDLPVLRGHISVVFHLLDMGTEMVHYYERHVGPNPSARHSSASKLVDTEQLLTILIEYAVAFSSYYLTSASTLCKQMLKRYAEVGEIEVSAPRYRGFHVRPSTLVAKIVLHYGSQVRMILGECDFDASTPLEIFRANEQINRWKRQWLAKEVADSPHLTNFEKHEIHEIVRNVIIELSESGRIIIYEQPLQMPNCSGSPDRSPLEIVVDEIARLQALGKIDIQADLSVRFRGDKRILADIELLARNGYGEDIFGNNIPLPTEISYLRR